MGRSEASSLRNPTLVGSSARRSPNLLVAATLDRPLQSRPGIGTQDRPVAHHDRIELLAEQLCGRASRHRWVRTQGLQDADPDLSGQAPERVGREEQTVRLTQERGVPEAVARGGDDAETRDQVALA